MGSRKCIRDRHELGLTFVMMVMMVCGFTVKNLILMAVIVT